MEKPREIANAGIEPARMFQRTFFWQTKHFKGVKVMKLGYKVSNPAQGIEPQLMPAPQRTNTGTSILCLQGLCS